MVRSFSVEAGKSWERSDRVFYVRRLSCVVGFTSSGALSVVTLSILVSSYLMFIFDDSYSWQAAHGLLVWCSLLCVVA